MIWDQKCPVIVMLTNIEENGKVCEGFILHYISGIFATITYLNFQIASNLLYFITLREGVNNTGMKTWTILWSQEGI